MRLTVLVSLVIIFAVAASAVSLPITPTSRALPSPARSGSGEPYLAVSPEGTVFLSWFEKGRADAYLLRIARLEGKRWSLPSTIAKGDSFFVNWADVPTLLALAGNRLIASYPWKSGPDTYAYDVRLTHSNDGGRTWSAGSSPHRDGTLTEHGFVSMVHEGQGARAIWLDGRNMATHGHGGAEHQTGDRPGMTVRSAAIGPDGIAGPDELIDERVCDCCNTAAVRTARGVLVAYRDRDASEIRDMALARLENGRWSTPVMLYQDGWEIAGCPVNGPALAASESLVVAAWYTAAADSPRVYAAFSRDAGLRFGSPIRVDQGNPLGRVDVVLLDDGSSLVAWLEARGTDALVQVRSVTANHELGIPLSLDQTTAKRSSGFPRLARSGNRVIAAWTAGGSKARVITAEIIIK